MYPRPRVANTRMVHKISDVDYEEPKVDLLEKAFDSVSVSDS